MRRASPAPPVGGIEWADEATDVLDPLEGGTDAPAAGRRGGPRRLWGAAALAAAAGAVVVYAVAARDGQPAPAPPTHAPVALPSSLPAPAPAPSGFVVHLGDRNGTLRNDVEVVLPQLNDPPACSAVRDGLSSCLVRTSVPPAVAAAVRARLGRAHLAGASTEVLESRDPRGARGLWSRRVLVTLGARTVRVVVSTSAAPYSLGANSFDDGNRVVDFAQHRFGRLTVQVQAIAPSGERDALDAVAALAADPRLLSLG